MKKHNRSILFAGAAAGVLGMIGFAGSALAYDTVNWDWQNMTLENVAVDGQINLNLDPTGLVQLEKMQIFIGDAIASSEVHNINNIQPTPAGDGTVSFTVDWSGTENDVPNPSEFGTGILGGPQATLSGDLTGAGDIYGTLDEGSDAMQLSATFTDIPVSVSASDSYDALTQLPEVTSAATASATTRRSQAMSASPCMTHSSCSAGTIPTRRGRSATSIPGTLACLPLWPS